MTRITIVDENDQVIGAAERSVVRAEGLRHRIVRVFIYNSDGKLLLHKRSEQADDNVGKWDQSAGGHVDEDEDYLAAAQRETKEELGISPDSFTQLDTFYIERPVPGGYARRFLTVFVAPWDGAVTFDPKEISEVRWCSIDEIAAWLQKNPGDFTKNFPKAFALARKYLEQQY
jgi:isopentenyl-diphosphate delta-isomerase